MRCAFAPGRFRSGTWEHVGGQALLATTNTTPLDHASSSKEQQLFWCHIPRGHDHAVYVRIHCLIRRCGREFKLPWRKAGLLKSSRWLSGFGPVGCQQELSLSSSSVLLKRNPQASRRHGFLKSFNVRTINLLSRFRAGISLLALLHSG